jgi:hypothetical protein
MKVVKRMELGGRMRRLAFDFNSEIAIMQETGESFGVVLQSYFSDGSLIAEIEACEDPEQKERLRKIQQAERIAAVRLLLYAAVVGSSPDLKHDPNALMTVGSWIEDGNVAEIMKNLGEMVKSLVPPPEFEGQLAPFVPTPESVVLAMVRMAEIADDSLVIDLGAGDGRLLFAAVDAASNVSGIGYELHEGRAEKIEAESHRRVPVKPVAVIREDIRTANVSAADVVFVYLLDPSNMALRDKLRGEMKAGARLISHDFGMGDWKPDATETVNATDRPHRVYKWVIDEKPAVSAV